MRFVISFLILLLIFVGQAWADCKSDCQNDYQSEVNSCRSQFDDPDDADDLTTCLDDAKRDYESCLTDCEEESDSAETRIESRDRLGQKVERATL